MPGAPFIPTGSTMNLPQFDQGFKKGPSLIPGLNSKTNSVDWASQAFSFVPNIPYTTGPQ